MDTLRVPTDPVDAPSVPPLAPGVRAGGAAPPTESLPPPPGLRSVTPPPLHHPASTLVLVATLDRAGIQSLTRRLLHRAAVRGVRNAFELVYAIESHRDARAIVIIDCCVPSVDPEMVATLVGALGALPLVVLWGASEPVHRQVRRSAPAARNWVRLEPSATDADVAELVDDLL